MVIGLCCVGGEGEKSFPQKQYDYANGHEQFETIYSDKKHRR